MLRKIKSHLAILLMLALAFTLLIPAPVQAASKAPAKVTIASVKTSGTNKVVIKWRKAKYATNYRIYWKQAGTKKWRTLATVKSNRTSYTHKSSSKAKLVGGKKYVYTVRAYNRYGRKWGAYNSKGKTVIIPAVPGKVNITQTNATSSRKVTITWNKTSNATSYRVFYKKSGAKKWITVANVSASKNSYTHSNNKKTPLAAGSKYVYTVRAYNKTSRKWGAYNTNGVIVTVPKKNAPAPTQPAKPTAVPTQKPKPTTPVIPSPSPEDTPDISGPTSTPTPAPAKPTEAPKPTATPVPAKPTATPVPAKPTATPAPVKVSNVTVNPATVKLTSKGQNIQLSVSVLPSNAENQSISWSSSDTSVATVSSDGTVTAVSNGTTTVTASAVDGSGKNGSCNVVVEIPNENLETITIEGGKSNSVSIGKTFYPDIIDFKKVTFEYYNSNGILYNDRITYNSRSAALSFRALRKGQIEIIVRYNGAYLKKCLIVVTSNWNEYLAYESWRHSIENQIWTNDMSSKDKMDAAKNYIQTHFTHKDGSPAAWYAYTGTVADCITASEFMGGFAADAGLKIQYGSTLSGQYYDYLVEASSAGGHTFTRILINNSWVIYDANPPH